MRNEADLFQRQCLANLKTIQNDPIDLDNFENRLNSLNSLKEEKDAALNLEKEVYCSLFQIRELRLNNKGLVFYEDDKEWYFGSRFLFWFSVSS